MLYSQCKLIIPPAKYTRVNHTFEPKDGIRRILRKWFNVGKKQEQPKDYYFDMLIETPTPNSFPLYQTIPYVSIDPLMLFGVTPHHIKNNHVWCEVVYFLHHNERNLPAHASMPFNAMIGN